MATKSLQSIQHPNSITIRNRRRHSIDFLPPSLPSSVFRQSATTPNTTISTTAFSASSSATTTASPTSEPLTFNLLEQHLSAQNFRQADEETRRLIILLAGEAAKKRGYVFFSEVKFISKEDLAGIDNLWRKYSDGKFGYRVQKRIWEKVNKDFSRFFVDVGWMKRLETSEIEQYNYRAFPNEFVWEMKEDTPVGHLPLTNALRGTQLLNCILTHPAFEGSEDGEDEEEVKGSESSSGNLKGSLSKKLFKPNYSF